MGQFGIASCVVLACAVSASFGHPHHNHTSAPPDPAELCWSGADGRYVPEDECSSCCMHGLHNEKFERRCGGWLTCNASSLLGSTVISAVLAALCFFAVGVAFYLHKNRTGDERGGGSSDDAGTDGASEGRDVEAARGAAVPNPFPVTASSMRHHDHHHRSSLPSALPKAMMATFDSVESSHV